MHPLAEAVIAYLMEDIVDTQVIDMSLTPGETQYQMNVVLMIYERGKSKGAKGFGPEQEGQWHQVSGIRPDRGFIPWLMTVLAPFNPSQPRRTPISQSYGIKDKWDISIDRPIYSQPELGRTDEQIFHAVLRKSPALEWFRIDGNPDTGVWSVVVQIEEPGYVVKPETVRREREAQLAQSRQIVVRQYDGIVKSLADRLGSDQPIVDVALGDYLVAHGFSEPFEIHLVTYDEAQRALEVARHLSPEELRPFVESLEESYLRGLDVT